MSNPPSASTSLYFDHSHLTSSIYSPSSLKKPFSTAQKLGASQVIPIYPTRTLVRLSSTVGDAAKLLSQFAARSTVLRAVAIKSSERDMVQYGEAKVEEKQKLPHPLNGVGKTLTFIRPASSNMAAVVSRAARRPAFRGCCASPFV